MPSWEANDDRERSESLEEVAQLQREEDACPICEAYADQAHAPDCPLGILEDE